MFSMLVALAGHKSGRGKGGLCRVSRGYVSAVARLLASRRVRRARQHSLVSQRLIVSFRRYGRLLPGTD